MALAIAGGGARAWRGLADRRDRRALRALFSRFVSEPVVDQIMKERDLFMSGGRPAAAGTDRDRAVRRRGRVHHDLRRTGAGTADRLAGPLYRYDGGAHHGARRRAAAVHRRWHPGGVRRAHSTTG